MPDLCQFFFFPSYWACSYPTWKQFSRAISMHVSSRTFCDLTRSQSWERMISPNSIGSKEESPMVDKVDQSLSRRDLSVKSHQIGLHGCQPVGLRATFQESPIQEWWFPTESKLPLNVLELRAIYLPLLHFKTLLQGHHVLIGTDNIAAKSYKEALKLISWAENHLASQWQSTSRVQWTYRQIS